MEKKDVMVDLRINRRESGLCNKDLAHLLDISASRVARLQTGNATLTVDELIALCLIFGKNVDQLLARTSEQIARQIKLSLADMPDEPDNWIAHDKRLDCLNALIERLQVLTLPTYDF